MKSKIIICLITVISIFNGFSQESNTSPFIKHSTLEGLCSNIIYDIAKDYQGNIWVATDSCLHKFNGLSFKIITSDHSKIVKFFGKKDSLFGLAEEGTIYSISNLSAVYYSHITTKLPLIIPNTLVWNDSLLISLILPQSTLVLKSDGTEKTLNYDSTSHFLININNELFCGLSPNPTNKLLYITEDDSLTFKLSKSSSPSKSNAIRLKNNSILYAKDFELINFNEDGIISRSYVESSIQDLFEDSNGKIWVGLYNGVVIFPTNNINEDNAIRYLRKHPVSSIIEDQNGDIWIATTDDGIYILPNQPAIAYTTPKIFSDSSQKVTSIKSNTNHGSFASNTNSNTKMLALNSNIYDSLPPKIFITNVRIMNKDTVVKNIYTLDYDQNFITVDYNGFSTVDSEKLRFRYRLKGLSSGKWIYTNNSSVQYTTLPPSSYEFNVQSINKYGIWSNEYAVITFNITPPFWEYMIFKLLMMLLLVIFSSISMYLYSNRIKEKAKIQKQIDSLELEALKSHMNPHFLFNTLSSIQYYITQSDNKSALLYLSKFAKLMRKILDNSQQSTISIQHEIEALELYLSLEQIRFEDKLSYSITIDDSINTQLDKIPSMLIQPYAENAILHGILHKKSNGHITINIKKPHNSIVCEIIDNGVGRKKAAEIETSKTKSHKSSGLSITKQRLEILNSSLSSNMSVVITDLIDNKIAAGTKVTISIPL
jgi:hypothetical protein